MVLPDPSPEHLYSFRIRLDGEELAILEVILIPYLVRSFKTIIVSNSMAAWIKAYISLVFLWSHASLPCLLLPNLSHIPITLCYPVWLCEKGVVHFRNHKLAILMLYWWSSASRLHIRKPHTDLLKFSEPTFTHAFGNWCDWSFTQAPNRRALIFILLDIDLNFVEI